MSAVIMYGSAIIAVAVVIFMLIKKMDIKITLFLMGILLMFIGMAMGNGIGVKDFASTGAVWLDPLKAVADQFKDTLRSAGFIILILGGYSAYMSHIGANEVTVSVLTKPIKHIKSAYILVPWSSCWGTCCPWSFPAPPIWRSSYWPPSFRCWCSRV